MKREVVVCLGDIVDHHCLNLHRLGLTTLNKLISEFWNVNYDFNKQNIRNSLSPKKCLHYILQIYIQIYTVTMDDLEVR